MPISNEEQQFHNEIDRFIAKKYPTWFKGRVKTEHKQELYHKCGLQSWTSPECEHVANNETEMLFKPVIGFESLRSLKRYYLWQLICNVANQSVTPEQAFQSLNELQKQDNNNPEDYLAFETFTRLLEQAQQLTEQQREVIGDTAFIHMSKAASQQMQAINSSSEQDSELFLQQAAQLEKAHYQIFKVTANYDDDKRQMLAQCYPNRLHMRHLMFAEASAEEFQAARKATADEQDFKMGMGRWLVDLLGFAGGNTINEINAKRFLNTQALFKQASPHLTVDQATHSIQQILNAVPDDLGIELQQRDKDARLLTSFLLAGYPTTNQKEANAIEKTIIESPYKAITASSYQNTLTHAAYMPTYMPALFKNALKRSKQLYQDEQLAISTATHFALQTFQLAFQKQQRSHNCPISLKQTAEMTHEDINKPETDKILQEIANGNDINIKLDESNNVSFDDFEEVPLNDDEDQAPTTTKQSTCSKFCESFCCFFAKSPIQKGETPSNQDDQEPSYIQLDTM